LSKPSLLAREEIGIEARIHDQLAGHCNADHLHELIRKAWVSEKADVTPCNRIRTIRM
jgi:hypothetical protein